MLSLSKFVAEVLDLVVLVHHKVTRDLVRRLTHLSQVLRVLSPSLGSHLGGRLVVLRPSPVAAFLREVVLHIDVEVPALLSLELRTSSALGSGVDEAVRIPAAVPTLDSEVGGTA